MTGAPPAGGRDRRALERIEESILGACALRSARAERRHPVDPEGRSFDLRTSFQRDRDRIIHSRAFRRLRHKTQLFLPDRDDHARNRLLHTLEVAGVARTLARALSLNEDLAEAIALGHALGHGAFGLPGERVLHGVLTGRIAVPGLDPKVAARCGGFRHNHQSLRVVDLLEKRYRHPGLNLTDPVREGVLKSAPATAGVEYPDVETAGLHPDLPPHLEAQAVALAEAIATPVHDLDDGLAEEAVTLEEAGRLRLVQQLSVRLGDSLERGRFLRAGQINRAAVHLLVTAAVTHSAAGLVAWCERHGVDDHERFLEQRAALPAELVALPPAAAELHAELVAFVERRVINSARVSRADERARRVLLELFTAWYRQPALLEDHLLLRYREMTGVRYLRDIPPAAAAAEVRERYWNQPPFVRLLADHLAGMTDTFALREADRLSGAVPPA